MAAQFCERPHKSYGYILKFVTSDTILENPEEDAGDCKTNGT